MLTRAYTTRTKKCFFLKICMTTQAIRIEGKPAVSSVHSAFHGSGAGRLNNSPSLGRWMRRRGFSPRGNLVTRSAESGEILLRGIASTRREGGTAIRTSWALLTWTLGWKLIIAFLTLIGLAFTPSCFQCSDGGWCCERWSRSPRVGSDCEYVAGDGD